MCMLLTFLQHPLYERLATTPCCFETSIEYKVDSMQTIIIMIQFIGKEVPKRWGPRVAASPYYYVWFYGMHIAQPKHFLT